MLKENEEKVLYSNSSFPLSFFDSKLFLGLNFHRNSKKIQNDLGIKYIVEIIEQPEEKNRMELKENTLTIYLNK